MLVHQGRGSAAASLPRGAGQHTYSSAPPLLLTPEESKAISNFTALNILFLIFCLFVCFLYPLAADLHRKVPMGSGEISLYRYRLCQDAWAALGHSCPSSVFLSLPHHYKPFTFSYLNAYFWSVYSDFFRGKKNPTTLLCYLIKTWLHQQSSLWFYSSPAELGGFPLIKVNSIETKLDI